MRAIYLETDLKLPDDIIKKLAKLDLESKKEIYIDENIIAFDYFPDAAGNSEKIKNFISVYKKEYIELFFNSITDEIKKTITTKDYGAAIDLLKKIQSQKNEKIKKLLLENSFFIPDLSGDISKIEWTFCHKVAEMASRFELKQQYKTSITSLL